MNILDVTFDLETTALTPNAAVMSIGAVAWDRDCLRGNPFILPVYDDEGNAIKDESTKMPCTFDYSIDLRSQFVNDFDFDKSTAQWWQRQSDAAKASVAYTPIGGRLEQAIPAFFDFIDEIVKSHGYDGYNLWSQGTDFDIAILRNAISKLLPDYKPNIKHVRFRDCRTFILEMCDIAAKYDRDLEDFILHDDFLKNPNKVYDYLPDIPESTRVTLKYITAAPHSSLYDAVRSSWNVYVMLKYLEHLINRNFKIPYNLLKDNH